MADLVSWIPIWSRCRLTCLPTFQGGFEVSDTIALFAIRKFPRIRGQNIQNPSNILQGRPQKGTPPPQFIETAISDPRMGSSRVPPPKAAYVI